MTEQEVALITGITWQDLINDMMKNDLKLMTKDVYLKDGGYKIMSYFE